MKLYPFRISKSRLFFYSAIILLQLPYMETVLAENVKSNTVAAGQAVKTIYVSPQGNDGAAGNLSTPYATLSKAITVATQSTSSVNIIMRGGRYELTQPQVIDQQGLMPLTISAYTNEKPVFSGGTKLPNNWTVGTVNGRTVWSQVLPEVAAGTWYFRQLWVNGQRATVPVIPKNSGFLQMKDLLISDANRAKQSPWQYSSKDGFIFNSGDFKSNWHALEDVYVISSSFWLHNYHTIKSVDESTLTVNFNENNAPFNLIVAHPTHGKFVGENRTVAYDWKIFYEPGHYRIYNVYEALSEPGEFYLDRITGKLSYIPRAGESPTTAEVVAPRITQLLVVKGTTGSNIQNVVLDGITFSHTEVIPEKHVGTGNQYNQPAVVQFDAVSLSTIKNCEFSHLGETALQMINGSRDMDVVGNSFFDLGSGAIATYGAFGVRASSAQITSGTTMRLRITDNQITNGGRLFPGHPAVLINKTRNSIIAFNEINDFFFNGICVLAGGDFDFSAVDNQVLNNHVHHMGQGHWTGNDMAALYNGAAGLGVDLVGNVLHDINCTSYAASGIYLDGDANHFQIRNNLIYNTNYDGMHIKGYSHVAENNIIYNCSSAFAQVSSIKFEEPVIALKHNIFVPTSPMVYNSKYVKPVDFNFLSENNLISTLESGSQVQVTQRGSYGIKYVNSMTFDAWQKGLALDKGSVVAPVTFTNPAAGDFTMDKATLNQAKALGFIPFTINAGPRPIAQRTLISFKPDNEAINSAAFKQYVEWVELRDMIIDGGFVTTVAGNFTTLNSISVVPDTIARGTWGGVNTYTADAQLANVGVTAGGVTGNSAFFTPGSSTPSSSTTYLFQRLPSPSRLSTTRPYTLSLSIRADNPNVKVYAYIKSRLSSKYAMRADWTTGKTYAWCLLNSNVPTSWTPYAQSFLFSQQVTSTASTSVPVATAFTETELNDMIVGFYSTGGKVYIDNVKLTGDVVTQPPTSLITPISKGDDKFLALNGHQISVLNYSGDLITVYNMTGQLVLKTNKQVFDLERSGLYIVKMGNKVQRILIDH